MYFILSQIFSNQVKYDMNMSSFLWVGWSPLGWQHLKSPQGYGYWAGLGAGDEADRTLGTRESTLHLDPRKLCMAQKQTHLNLKGCLGQLWLQIKCYFFLLFLGTTKCPRFLLWEISVLTRNLPSIWRDVCLGSELSCCKGNKVFITHMSLWTMIPVNLA